MKFFNLLYLRKTKIFNKARYSRNRQLARVIFYFSLYINIIIIYYTFNVVYGLSFILGWFWWLNFFLLTSIIWGIFLRSYNTLIKMFTFFYSNNIYRFFKSGFLLDFYFKKFFFNILFIFYYYFNILFSEKYFIEHNFLKILKYVDFFKNLINIFSQFFSIYQIGVIFLVVFTLIFFSINV